MEDTAIASLPRYVEDDDGSPTDDESDLQDGANGGSGDQGSTQAEMNPNTPANAATSGLIDLDPKKVLSNLPLDFKCSYCPAGFSWGFDCADNELYCTSKDKTPGERALIEADPGYIPPETPCIPPSRAGLRERPCYLHN